MRSIADILRDGARNISHTLAQDLTTSRVEIRMLLQRALGVARVYLSAHPEQQLDGVQQARLDSLLQRRLRGEPLAHILGEREFFGLDFKVTPDTLIPRPETELLVELVLERLPPPVFSHAQTTVAPRPTTTGNGCGLRVLDLGTGSGAIALSIAHTRPDVELVAVDTSAAALAVAVENAQCLGLRNVRFVQSDWCEALDDQCFDFIVANPPYIAASDTHLKQGDVRFEPWSALASGVDGLDDIRRIVAAAPRFLCSGGWLILEHGYDQAGAVRDLLNRQGFVAVFSARDLAGIERVSAGKLP